MLFLSFEYNLHGGLGLLGVVMDSIGALLQHRRCGGRQVNTNERNV